MKKVRLSSVGYYFTQGIESNNPATKLVAIIYAETYYSTQEVEGVTKNNRKS